MRREGDRGRGGGGSRGTCPTYPCRYDPHINKWTEVAPMAKRRAGVGVVALNGYLYAVGGFDDASPLDTVERYNLRDVEVVWRVESVEVAVL